MALFKKINKFSQENEELKKKEKRFDRTFILMGKASSGKSTLGNLLLGRNERFKTHKSKSAFGETKKVQQDGNMIDPSQIYDTREERECDKLNIQVFDQPGSNDCDFTQEKYCEFLRKCISESNAEMTATFLILINLKSSLFSAEEILTIINIAEVLSDSSYSFFPNAILVFTHADLLMKKSKRDKYPDYSDDSKDESNDDSDESDGDMEMHSEDLAISQRIRDSSEKDFQNNLEVILDKKLKKERYSCIKDLIDLTERRYIFVNGTDTSEINRYDILKKLFDLSRPKLNVYINGNTIFQGKELKKIFKEDPRIKSFEKNSLKYDVEYHFNPDLNIFKKFEIKDLEDDIVSALDKLSGITKGISAMVLLISLQEVFNNEIYNLILNLPKTYNLGEDFRKDFWNYACIVYKVPDDSEEIVKHNIENNRLLKDLNRKVNFRYTWVTKKTLPDDCSRRLTDLVRKVKVETEGKSYTDSVVLAEMNQKIKMSYKLRKSQSKVKINGDIKNADLQEIIPFYKSKSDSKVFVASNNFFSDKETISPMVGYFILKNINQTIAKKFREEYKDNSIKIPTKDYKQYCMRALKDLDL